jgi:predicted RNase H-like nuclease (RuvC/YqgF family)
MENNLIGKANEFNEKIKTAKTQFFSSLDDFKKYYVYYNKNPEVDEFQNNYVNSKSQLQGISRNLFLTTNNIDRNIENLDIKMRNINLKLEDEKRINEELMKILNNLENTQNGSETLIDNSKESYNKQYYYNWEIFTGILILSAVITKTFTH